MGMGLTRGSIVLDNGLVILLEVLSKGMIRLRLRLAGRVL